MFQKKMLLMGVALAVLGIVAVVPAASAAVSPDVYRGFGPGADLHGTGFYDGIICHNDPVNKVDYLGLEPLKQQELIAWYAMMYGVDGLELLNVFLSGSGNKLELGDVLGDGDLDGAHVWSSKGQPGYWAEIQIEEDISGPEAAQHLHRQLNRWAGSAAYQDLTADSDWTWQQMAMFRKAMYVGRGGDLAIATFNAEIAALSMVNEGADLAIVGSEFTRGNYVAGIGLLPFVPAVSGRVIRYADNGKPVAGFKTTDDLIRDGVNVDAFPWGTYYKRVNGPAPKWMGDKAHAHHILFRKGNGRKQKALVREGQEILLKYDIDPVFGPENLVWARNRIPKQHAGQALEEVLIALRHADNTIGTREAIVEALREMGQVAATR